MINVSSAESVLKEYYLDVVKEQVKTNVSPFFNAIEQTGENVSGKDVKLVIVKEDDHKIVAINEDSAINTTNNSGNKYYNVTLPLKNIYGGFEISDKIIRASTSSAGAMVSVLNAEMEGLISSAKAAFARMLFGDGSGYLFKSLGKIQGRTFLVDNPKPFLVGMNVKLKDDAGHTGSYYVNAVDVENSTITMSSELNDYDANTLKFYYNTGDNSEIIGLSGIFDYDTLYGYSKDSNPYFKPQIKRIGKGELTEDILVEMIDELWENNGGKVNIILCSHRMRRKIASLMSASRRIVNTTDVAAGISSVLINDVPVYADKYCPEDRIYFLNTEDFTLNQLCDWSWLEDDKGSILSPISKKAAFSACLVKYAELVCKRPCGQGLIQLVPSMPATEPAQG